MRKGQRTRLIISIGGLALGSVCFLLFDGDLDFGGHYEIVQTVAYSPDRKAFEIQRTDRQALNGPRYAVLIDDHTPTTLEMKHSLISFWRHRSFLLAERNIDIRWVGRNVLTLTTATPGPEPEWMMTQRRQIGDVVITYSGQH